MASTFLYEAPVVELTLEPSVGLPAGGTAVVLTGRGYQAGATVTFGGVPATGVTVVSSARITATTPAHAVGSVNVVVTNPDASTGTLTNGFTYQAAPPPAAVTYRTVGGGGGSGLRLRLETHAPKIEQTLGQPSTLSFSAKDEPAGEQPVEYQSFGQRLFLGTVTSKTERVDGADRLQVWDTECTDLTHRMARGPHPIGKWVATSATTILVSLIAGAPGFSSAGVEGGLPNLTVELDGTADTWSAIVDVCERAGAKVFLDGTTVHAFTVDSGFDPPGAVTEGNPDLIWTDPDNPITITWDYLSIRNSVTVRGAEGITALVEHASSIALYGQSCATINDNTLTTQAELIARAQAELAAWALPIPVAKYATRDLKTRAGKTVAITVARPAISGDFIITACTIDQLELAVSAPAQRPRFTATAKPARAMMRSPGDLVESLQTVVDLKANAAKQPRLDGDIVSEPGGRTTIPDNSIPATKLAGCIPSSKLNPTGVTPASYGDDAHLASFTVDAAGRLTVAGTDPVAVVKTDGSQPYTADQPMGGHTFTGLGAPTNPDDAATKGYVDAAIAGIVPTTYDSPLTATNPVGGFIYGETPAGSVNGSNTVFTTSTAYANLRVWLNGVRQKKTTHYTETSTTTFTFGDAPLTGDVVLIDYNGGAAPELVFDGSGNPIIVQVPL